MGAIDADIQSIVRNIAGDIPFLQPLFESITNALEANATEIVITLFDSETVDESFVASIDGFSVEDNGDGFTEENLKSFNTLWSNYKYSIGCKGSGRFTWLKVFKNIDIKSYIAKTKELIHIPFSINYSRDRYIRTTDSTISSTKTIIEFRNITDSFYKVLPEGKGVDKREESNPYFIKERILDYLVVKLNYFKKARREFKIVIKNSSSRVELTTEDLPTFLEKTFVIKNEFFNEDILFTIEYLFKDDKKNNRDVYLCSNMRSSHKIKPSSIYIDSKLPNKESCYFYISSRYFDLIDTDDRQGLNSYAHLKGTDELHFISYSDLLERIGEQIREIFNNKYPGLMFANDLLKEEIKKEKPYLSKYIEKSNPIVGSKETIEKNAKSEFEKDKVETQKKFLDALKNRHIDPDEFQKAVEAVSAISAAELCEYIVYRSKILDALSPDSLIDKKEEYLHNIFMPKKSDSFKRDYLATNMWVLDDKFMNYLYVSSDLPISVINKDGLDNSQRVDHDLKRPDMFLAYDKTGDVYKNAVLIEFKSYSAKHDEKCKALHQLPDSIGVLRKSNPKIQIIWGYIITKIDDDFRDTVLNNGYEPILTSKDKPGVYYSRNKNTNSHVYICDIDMLIEDAKLRNKIFADILKS